MTTDLVAPLTSTVTLTTARARLVRMPLARPWRTAFGDQNAIDTVVVTLGADDGTHASGEAAPGRWPAFCEEWGASSFDLLANRLLPDLLGLPAHDDARLQAQMAWVRGNHFAKAAVEHAFWALRGQAEGRSLASLIGGTRSSVMAGADLDIHDDLGLLMAKVAAVAETGCPRIKFKVSPEQGISHVAQVREEFPDLPMHIDCNGGFSSQDRDFFDSVDKLGLTMIEQPLPPDDVVGHARLQERLSTAICLDESIRSTRDLDLAAKLDCCRYINVKPGRVGGISYAAELGRQAAARGMGVVVGNMLESPLGAEVCLALASCEWATYPADLFPANRFFERSLTLTDLVRDGAWSFAVSTAVGNPAVIDEEAMAMWTVADTGEQCL